MAPIRPIGDEANTRDIPAQFLSVEDFKQGAEVGILTAHPQIPIPPKPIIINRPIVMVSNIAAGSGRGALNAVRFERSMFSMENTGMLRTGGDVINLRTVGDPALRTSALVRGIRGVTEAPIVISFGGDGTVADVGRAVLQTQTPDFRPILVPGPGGTAGDLAREIGMPRNPRNIVRFLAEAKPAEFDVFRIILDTKEGSKSVSLIHIQGHGVSGKVFKGVAAFAKKSGSKGVVTYLRGLAPGIMEAETFYVSINGSPRMPVGEVLIMANTTGAGAVARAPLPSHGARIFAVPLHPKLPGPSRLMPGLLPFTDGLIRGARYAIGDQTAISPWKQLRFFDSSRIHDVLPETSASVRFFDARGKPVAIPGIINGDIAGEAFGYRIISEGETLSTLALEHSALMVRRSNVVPRTVMHTLNRGLMSGLEFFQRYGAIILIGAREAYSAYYNETDAERAPVDTGMLVGMTLADSLASYQYGLTPYLAEMPLIIPQFGIGYHASSLGLSYVGEETGINTLKQRGVVNSLASLAVGIATVKGSFLLIGKETIALTSSHIWSLIIKYVGSSGLAIEHSILTFVKGASSASIFMPLIIINPDQKILFREDDSLVQES